MADNFRIARRVNADILHLKLSGDFDGTAAMELLDIIANNSGSAQRIHIETDGLRELLPFGLRVFEKKLSGFPAWGQKLVFTGAHSQEFFPADTTGIDTN